MIPERARFSRIEELDVVPAVEDEAIFISPLVVPLPVQVLADPVVRSKSLPVVIELDVRYPNVPEVKLLSVNTKAEVVVVPVATDEVNV